MIKDLIEWFNDMPFSISLLISIVAALLSMSSFFVTLFRSNILFFPKTNTDKLSSLSHNEYIMELSKLIASGSFPSLQDCINAIIEFINSEYDIEKEKIRVKIYMLSHNDSNNLNELIAYSVANDAEPSLLGISKNVENNNMKTIVVDKIPYVFIGDTKTYNNSNKYISQRGEWASFLSVPIKKDDEIVGMISIAILDRTMENKEKNESIITFVKDVASICSTIIDAKAKS